MVCWLAALRDNSHRLTVMNAGLSEDEAVIFLLNLHVFTRLHVNHFGIAAAQWDHTTAAGFDLIAGLTVASARGVSFSDGQALCSR